MHCRPKKDDQRARAQMTSGSDEPYIDGPADHDAASSGPVQLGTWEFQDANRPDTSPRIDGRAG